MSNQEKRQKDWRPEEKLEALNASAALDENELNAYCRKKVFTVTVLNNGKKILLT